MNTENQTVDLRPARTKSAAFFIRKKSARLHILYK